MATRKKAEDTEEAPAEPAPLVDRVAMVTRNADGTPRQTEGFEVIVADEEDATEE